MERLVEKCIFTKTVRIEDFEKFCNDKKVFIKEVVDNGVTWNFKLSCNEKLMNIYYLSAYIVLITPGIIPCYYKIELINENSTKNYSVISIQDFGHNNQTGWGRKYFYSLKFIKSNGFISQNSISINFSITQITSKTLLSLSQNYTHDPLSIITLSPIHKEYFSNKQIHMNSLIEQKMNSILSLLTTFYQLSYSYSESLYNKKKDLKNIFNNNTTVKDFNKFNFGNKFKNVKTKIDFLNKTLLNNSTLLNNKNIFNLLKMKLNNFPKRYDCLLKDSKIKVDDLFVGYIFSGESNVSENIGMDIWDRLMKLANREYLSKKYLGYFDKMGEFEGGGDYFVRLMCNSLNEIKTIQKEIKKSKEENIKIGKELKSINIIIDHKEKLKIENRLLDCEELKDDLNKISDTAKKEYLKNQNTLEEREIKIKSEIKNLKNDYKKFVGNFNEIIEHEKMFLQKSEDYSRLINEIETERSIIKDKYNDLNLLDDKLIIELRKIEDKCNCSLMFLERLNLFYSIIPVVLKEIYVKEENRLDSIDKKLEKENKDIMGMLYEQLIEKIKRSVISLVKIDLKIAFMKSELLLDSPEEIKDKFEKYIKESEKERNDVVISMEDDWGLIKDLGRKMDKKENIVSEFIELGLDMIEKHRDEFGEKVEVVKKGIEDAGVKMFGFIK